MALDITNLKTNFSGNIILPGDETYDVARVTYGVKDAKPAIITQAANNDDIAAAIAFARSGGLEVSIRSSGHNAAGFSTNNGGLVLDLSRMNTIEVLDQEAGLVRLGPGAVWGDVAAELGKHGLALSSGDTKSVAVGGLTLGGGIGWMFRKYGYAIDSLVAAEVVLADGSVVRASETENSDLFWALRGGSGNFGVVSSFEFKAHPQGKIVESMVMYGVDDLQNTITGWHDHMRSAPEDLTSFMSLMPGFGGGAPMVMVMSCYADNNEAAADAIFDPLRHLATEVRSDVTTVKDYAEVLQEAHPPEGLKFVVKNMYVKTFDDELAGLLAEICCKPGSPVVQLRMMDGPSARVSPEATAIAHRDNELFMFAGFPLPATATQEQEAEALKAWDKIAGYSTGTYANFLSELDEDVKSIYPAKTYERLAVVKQKYDPQNIFRHNYNIKPAV